MLLPLLGGNTVRLTSPPSPFLIEEGSPGLPLPGYSWSFRGIMIRSCVQT